MANQLLVDYLNRARALYSLESHPTTFTAISLARVGHIHAQNLAKTVLVSIDSELTMIVVPACYQLDLECLCDCLGADSVNLVAEAQFYRRFPRCEIGAVPPFGHLYGLRSLLTPLFAEDEQIAFTAGTHNELIRMPFREFQRLAHAVEVSPEVVMGAGYYGWAQPAANLYHQ